MSNNNVEALPKWLLTRHTTNDEGTSGGLIAPDGKTFCTLELPYYGADKAKLNQQRLDCIPAGIYTCVLRHSPRFKRMLYEVQNVPNRSAVLIHSGNVAGDITKGKESDVEGCILLGTKFGILKGQTAILDSKKALSAFMVQTKGEPFTLEITQPKGW